MPEEYIDLEYKVNIKHLLLYSLVWDNVHYHHKI